MPSSLRAGEMPVSCLLERCVAVDPGCGQPSKIFTLLISTNNVIRATDYQDERVAAWLESCLHVGVQSGYDAASVESRT